MQGYYGFDNPSLAAYLGIPVQQLQMLQEVLPQFSGMVNQSAIPQSSQQADVDLMRQLASTGGGGPMGQANTLENISAGLDYLGQHPAGSKYHGDINATDIVGNLATGGLYGLGKGAMGAAQTGKLSDLMGGANSLGLWGSVMNPLNPKMAQAGNLAGLGAGIGGGLAGGQGIGGGGFGSATPATLEPYYFGFEPGTLAGQGVGEFGQFAGGIPSAGMTGAPAAGLAGMAAGGTGTGATLGASAGQQFANLLGGGSPLSMPSAGGATMGVGGTTGPSQAQLASMGAQSSEAHKGLAPGFQNRMAGKQEQPGLANSQDLSLAALYGLGGGR